MKIKLTDFLDDIGDNCSYISFLSIRHILNKLYDDIETQSDDKTKLLEIIQDYSFLLRYLNDYAGVIYRQHSSSVELIYSELCKHFDLSIDNKYTFEHIVKKLQKQTPSLLMSLSDEDIKIQTIENFCEKLDNIKSSKYYLDNIDNLKDDISILEKNIALVKMASQIS
jgi:glutamyl/glutaminyl-tRNA synthetase